MILKVLCCLRVPFLWQASKEILEATTLRSILSKDLGDSELDVTEDWDFHLSSARGIWAWTFDLVRRVERQIIMTKPPRSPKKMVVFGTHMVEIFRLSQKFLVAGPWPMANIQNSVWSIRFWDEKMVQHRYLLKCLRYCPCLQDATVLELMQKRLASENMSMLCTLVEFFLV